jgi:hypothetical protein
MRVGGQGRRMRRVVLAARSLAAGCKCGVEVVGGAVLPLPGRDEPRDGVVGYPDGAAPSLDLHLEQDVVVNGRDPFLQGAVVGEPLAGLRQQGMRYLVQRCVGTRDGLPAVLAQASQRGPGALGHR